MDEQEEKVPSLLLEAAVLHCLDYSHGMTNLSEETLNIEDPFLEKFVLYPELDLDFLEKAFPLEGEK